MNAIIPRASIADMVRLRNESLSLFGKAHEMLISTSDAMKAAQLVAAQAAPSQQHYTHASDPEHRALLGVKVPVREDFIADVRKMVDRNIWARLVEITDLERLMDKEAKDQLRKQMSEDPVEVTEDNVFATLESFALQAGDIFKRGIANVFSKLDRRFRSHDGFKVGGRIVIDYVFDGNGFWSHSRGHRDTLMDVDRTFRVLDGKPEAHAYAGIVGEIEQARGRSWGARQTYLESDYFRIRAWKNGNVHIYFRRDDLVEKVNKLLAEYYGEVIPDGAATEEDVLNTPKRTVAKHFGFFPTPKPAVERVIVAADLHQQDKPLRVLEPSAGRGAIAEAVRANGHFVHCVEIQPDLVESLRAQRYPTTQADFLDVRPEPIYDRVIMNPPFDRERDIDHVMHALRFLKPDGILVAIMSAGTEFRETRKSAAFRAMVEKQSGRFRDLPAGSFSSVGTNVNTVILKMRADGRSVYF